MEPVYVVSAVRSAIGAFGGTLAGLSPSDLGRRVASEALTRAGLPEGKREAPNTIAEVIVGNVLGAGHGMNIARQVALKSGLSFSTPAYTVNKVCGSGLKAVTLAAQALQSGEADVILAGGVESMSQAGFVSMTTRAGVRLGHTEMRDLILQDGLTDVFDSCHMGITAENLAEAHSISRADQDRFALESQTRAAKAIAAGNFKEEIVPIAIEIRGKEPLPFATDEHPRAGTTLEALGKLRPAFKKDGTVTAGNASGINDGAAFLVLANAAGVRRLGAKPLAELTGFASAGVDPKHMGIGPVKAVERLLEKTKTSLKDVAWIEANEAFAAQALAVGKLLQWDPAKVNPNGGAIALGHPIGASGARILVTLLHQMKRTAAPSGIATLCVGGGQGIAVLVKAVR